MRAQIVSFHCVLRNKFGKIISSTYNRDVLTSSQSESDLLIGLVEGLRDLKKGDKRLISLRAEKAYGFYDPTKVVECMREDLGANSHLRRGDEVMLKLNNSAPRLMRVIGMQGDRITLDGNHPLAGQDLVFEIEAVSARDATPDDIGEPVEESGPNSLH